jgi:NAD(P)-dependent dehydrogenase (short-subunit alcohol dehydrogenase family)
MRFVITGANRGIGLELARQVAARGDFVEAGARDPGAAAELQVIAEREPARVRVHTCDVASDTSVRAFASSVGDVAVDVLINNAGVKGERRPLAEVDLEDALRTFDTNALGPLRVTRAFLANLRRGDGKRVVHMTSALASITDNTTGDAYAYRMSKAALNMASRSMAVDLRGEGILSVVLSPGWVKTDMGGPRAPLSVEESVRGMLGIIDRLTLEQSGLFFDYQGLAIAF